VERENFYFHVSVLSRPAGRTVLARAGPASLSHRFPAGAAIILGLVRPVAAAASIGVMATTAVTVHRKNGFFIFEDGYKYVLVLAAGLVSLSILGAGRFSLDHAQGTGFNGLYAGLGAAALGCLGSAGLLIGCWQPSRVSS